MALHFAWPVKQLDVRNAFLRGSVQEELSMDQLLGFSDPRFPNHVCHLNKAIYELKQAPRAWYERFSHFITSLGFRICLSDNSVFVRHTPTSITIVLIYVDDILVTGSDSRYISHLLQAFQSHFDIRDLGDIHYFLGIEITRTASSFFTQSI